MSDLLSHSSIMDESDRKMYVWEREALEWLDAWWREHPDTWINGMAAHMLENWRAGGRTLRALRRV
jgi:hypothetical protein